VLVFEETDSLRSPHNDVVVSTTRGPSLAILRVCQRVHDIFMGALLIDDLTRNCIINEYAVANSHEDLSAVRSVAYGPNRVGVSRFNWGCRL
jgi:hypothetical protein